MTPATHVPTAFPPAGSPTGGRQMQPGSMHGWDREWKRAEVAAWFRGASPAAERAAEERTDAARFPAAAEGRGPLPGSSPRHVGVAGKPSAAMSTEGIAAVRGATACAATVAADAGGMVRGTLPPAQPTAESHQSTPGAMPCVVRHGPAGAGSAARVATAPYSLTTPAPSRVAAPAVHVHLERDGEGVRVWLGIPANEQAALLRASALVAALRRSLATEGYRLSAAVCNGAPIHAEQPVPRATQPTKEQP